MNNSALSVEKTPSNKAYPFFTVYTHSELLLATPQLSSRQNMRPQTSRAPVAARRAPQQRRILGQEDLISQYINYVQRKKVVITTTAGSGAARA